MRQTRMEESKKNFSLFSSLKRIAEDSFEEASRRSAGFINGAKKESIKVNIPALIYFAQQKRNF